MKKSNSILFWFVLIVFAINVNGQESSQMKIDVSGKWVFSRDEAKVGLAEKWYYGKLKTMGSGPSEIALRGTTDATKAGIRNAQKPNLDTLYRPNIHNVTTWHQREKVVNLVPDLPSKAPISFCTWSVQGYVSSYLSNEAQRKAMNEQNIFGSGKYQNWINFYPQIRKDIYFLMDDSWDIPLTENSAGANKYIGMVELDTTRFPSYKGTSAERLTKLVQKVKAEGWKGLGCWISAQEALVCGQVDPEKYWIKRLKDANVAGVAYWKVDWGRQSQNLKWRNTLTSLGRKYAPNLIIEHALVKKAIEFSDVYRTYDVEYIISIPTTIDRVADMLHYNTRGDARGLINCEDEPYIAAGLGCTIGIMRYPFKGNLPNGTQDFVYPSVGRDVGKRSDEDIRFVRWSRIAEPFGVGTTSFSIDSLQLNDYWILHNRENWEDIPSGDTIAYKAFARVSRGLELPIIKNANPKNQPYVLSSQYPNGAAAIVTQGRTLKREYVFKAENIIQKLNHLYKPLGIFGRYATLTLEFPGIINASEIKVYAQDLAGSKAEDITRRIKIIGQKIIVPGKLINEIGLSNASKNDVSDAGLVMQVFKK